MQRALEQRRGAARERDVAVDLRLRQRDLQIVQRNTEQQAGFTGKIGQSGLRGDPFQGWQGGAHQTGQSGQIRDIGFDADVRAGQPGGIGDQSGERYFRAGCGKRQVEVHRLPRFGEQNAVRTELAIQGERHGFGTGRHCDADIPVRCAAGQDEGADRQRDGGRHFRIAVSDLPVCQLDPVDMNREGTLFRRHTRRWVEPGGRLRAWLEAPVADPLRVQLQQDIGAADNQTVDLDLTVQQRQQRQL